jgi:translation machinery-associated protein 16
LHALPPEAPCLTLEELHGLVKDVWLTRHDPSLQKEQSLRRQGRPKSSKEDQLEEWKRQDSEEYRTGLDLPDLLDPHNIGLFRQWDGVDVHYLRILKFIRISAEFPETVHVARFGRDKNPPPRAEGSVSGPEEDEQMESAETQGPFEDVGSTMLSMDEIHH